MKMKQAITRKNTKMGSQPIEGPITAERFGPGDPLPDGWTEVPITRQKPRPEKT